MQYSLLEGISALQLTWGYQYGSDKVLHFASIYVTSRRKFIAKMFVGSSCGSVGRAVASDTRGPRFEFSHWQILYWTLFTVNCIEKTKIKKKEARMAHFLEKHRLVKCLGAFSRSRALPFCFRFTHFLLPSSLAGHKLAWELSIDPRDSNERGKREESELEK